jgi:hypothetical protein
MCRGRAARMTFIDKADNALRQIKQIRLRHRESPLSEVNPTAHQNPLDQAECPML